MNQLQSQLGDMLLFVVVVQAQSFAAAAKRLHLPASTLSRRIAAFEKKIGCQLIQRTTRSLRLLPSAQAYYDACVQTIQCAEQAHALLLTPEAQNHHLRIAMPVDFGVHILAPICSAFAHENKQITFDVILNAAPIDLMREPFDLAFRIGRPMDDRVVARKLAEVRSGLYASPDCVRALPPLTNPAQLRDWPCIRLLTGRGEMPWHVDTHKWKHAPGPARLGAASVGFVLQLALDGHGVALLPQHLAGPHCENGELLRLFPKANTPVWPLFADTARRVLSPAVKELITYTKDSLLSQYQGTM